MEKEKNAWLDTYLPEMDKAHRIFVPCCENKLDYVPNANDKCFLLDDYTPNLNQWISPECGIKLLNGINFTNGTWQGNRIRFDAPASHIVKNLTDITLHGAAVKETICHQPSTLQNYFQSRYTPESVKSVRGR